MIKLEYFHNKNHKWILFVFDINELKKMLFIIIPFRQSN